MSKGAAKSSNPIRRASRALRDLQQRHRERHQPTGFGFVFADRIDYLDAKRWDEVTAGQSIYLRRDILRVVENHGPENLQPRYVIIFRGEKPVAAIAAQIITVTGKKFGRDENAPPVKRNLLQRALTPAVKEAGKQLREKILVAGNLLSWGFHGIAFAPGEDHVAIWPGIAEALYRLRRSERLSGETDFVMVKDLTERQTGLDGLRRFSYRSVETEPNMVLDIHPSWKNYDDYLAALDAKYRRNAKDQSKKLAAAECVVESLTDFSTHAARLHELYLSVHGNSPIRMVTLPATYLPALARAAGEDFRCSVVRRGEKILGFITSLRDGETAIGYYIGFDRAAAAEGLPIYLRLLHTTIADAIAWRCQKLSLGRSALEPKAALGAKPEAMSVWMRHRVPAMNWMIRSLLQSVPHHEAPERNPFKTVAPPAK